MSNSKGLSQILYLIIAASVLMIAALSLVFMLNDGLSGIIDFGGDSQQQACERSLEARCAGLASDASIDDAPTACMSNGEEIPPYTTSTQCSQYQ